MYSGVGAGMGDGTSYWLYSIVCVGSGILRFLVVVCCGCFMPSSVAVYLGVVVLEQMLLEHLGHRNVCIFCFFW